MMKIINKSIFCFTAFLASMLLAGCNTSTPVSQKDSAPIQKNIDANKIKNPVPQKLPLVASANHTYRVDGKTYHVLKSPYGYHAVGTASWYGTKFDGHPTSTGEQYNMLSMTAASKVLPLPCFARVTNLKTHKSIIVKINDRGPFEKNRLIDLSYAAALKLGIANHGVGLVAVDTIDPKHPDASLHLPAKHEKLTTCFDKQEIYYIIHIASYKNARDANNLINKLKSHGVTAEVLHYNNIYLVQTKATSQQEVTTIKNKLSHTGFTHVVVQKTTDHFAATKKDTIHG